MKKICILFMSAVAITVQASQESKLAELEKVVTEIATYAPKVITEGKQIYTELQPVIQKIQQYMAAKKAAKLATSSVTTTSTMSTSAVATTSTTTTTTSTVPPAVSGVSPIMGTQSQPLIQEKGDKGKEKDNAVLLVPATTTVAPALVSPAIAKLAETSEQFTAEQVMVILQAFSPKIYEFGQKYNISAHDLLLFSHVLHAYQIEPKAIVEFIKSHHQLDDITAQSWTVGEYTTIKDKAPDKYQMLGLAIIKELFDQEDGKQAPSVLDSTHIDILHNKVADQQTGIQLRNGGLLGTVALILISLPWGSVFTYLYAHNNSSVPLNGTVTG